MDLQEILYKYKNSNNKDNNGKATINDLVANIRNICDRLNIKGKKEILEQLELILDKYSQSDKYVTKDGINLILYSDDYIINALSMLQSRACQMTENQIYLDRSEEYISKLDTLIDSFTPGSLFATIKQYQTLESLIAEIFQGYDHLIPYNQSEINEKLLQYFEVIVGSNDFYTNDIINNYEKEYSSHIKFEPQILLKLIKKLETDLSLINIPEEFNE